MGSKSFIVVSLFSLLLYSTNTQAVVDFENYTPTLNNTENAEIESAYLLSYEKTTEENADFSTYEKDTNGQWQKVFYKYDVTYDASKSSKPVQFAEGENQDEVIAHYFDIIDSELGENMGNTIVNNAVIDKVQGDFIGNTLESANSGASGTVIYNTNTISEVTGDFINNSAKGNSNVSGGAIYNGAGSERTIGKISGNFIGNTVVSAISFGLGGAIQNEGKIEDIKGLFINNSAISNGYVARGGAISNFTVNTSEIGDINADFIGNNIYSTNGSQGGAIYNVGIIGDINGDFIGNYATGDLVKYFDAKGGAIYNAQEFGQSKYMGKITGDFIGNYVHANSNASGGAIFNDTIISGIEGDFVKNKAISADGVAQGGAISNDGEITSIKGDFSENAAYTDSSVVYGGALYNGYSANIQSIEGDFIKNSAVSGYQYDSAQVKGGAIYSASTNPIVSIKGDFIENFASYTKNGSETQVFGGAIFIEEGSTITNITGDFRGNFVKGLQSTDFNMLTVGGGAIYNQGNMGLTTTSEKKNIVIENNKIITVDSSGKEEVKLNFMDLVAREEITVKDGEEIKNASNVSISLHTIEDSYISIKDPFRSISNYTKIDPENELYEDGTYVGGNYGVINKTGAGSMYLWGDNSEFYGSIVINEGDFVAMFDEADEYVQRHEFDLSNATVNFGKDTTFRPMVTSDKIAILSGYSLSPGTVDVRPFNVSSLDSGKYSYKGAYHNFNGMENDLIKVDATSTSLDVSVKKNLAGYEGLGSAVDAYRKLSNLSVSDRMIFDNIYYTGSVSQEIKDEFKEVIKVVSGEDKIIINEVHKASIRQFSRQIYSRIQNKNCPSCGMTEGYSDEHLWFNVGKNFIDKDTNGENVGYKYDPTSLAIGYDHDIIPNALNMGIAFNYAFGEVKGKGKSIYNTADIDEYMLSLYWKYKPLRAYMTGSVGGGYMNSESKVKGDSIDVRGDSDTRVAFINTEFGYDFGNACGVLEPFVGLEYAYIYNKAYTEKGLGARHFNSSDYNSIELPIGFRVSRNMVLDSYIFTPSIELAYSRSLGDRSSEVSSYFVGNPESPWVMRGANDSRDSLRSSLNLKINNIYNPFALNFGYARDTRSDYSDDQLYLTVRYNF